MKQEVLFELDEVNENNIDFIWETLIAAESFIKCVPLYLEFGKDTPPEMENSYNSVLEKIKKAQREMSKIN